MMKRLFILLLLFSALAGAQVFPGSVATRQDLLQAFYQCETTLSSGVTAGSISLPVASTACFTFASPGGTTVTIDNEVIRVCGTEAGPALTVCPSGRGFEGTDPASHASGEAVQARVTPEFHEAMAREMIAVQTELQPFTLPDFDISGKNSTRPVKIGTVLPGTCVIGELFFDTDAPAGQNVFGCTATNVWSLMGDGGGVESVTGTAGEITVGGTAANPIISIPIFFDLQGHLFVGANSVFGFEGLVFDAWQTSLVITEPTQNNDFVIPDFDVTFTPTPTPDATVVAEPDGKLNDGWISDNLKLVTFGITIPSPTTADDAIHSWSFPVALTLRKLWCVTPAATTVTIQLEDRGKTAREAAGTNMLTLNLPCDADTEETASFSDPSLNAEDFAVLEIISTSGSPAWVNIFGYGTKN